MIELRNVRKTYDNGKTWAVDGASLTVGEGELLALIGESGCGKTTTLKMINRLAEPTSGEVRVAGRDVMAHDPQSLRRNIGYVFQGIGLFPHYSVAENVAAVPGLLKWDAGRVAARCRETLELVGLPPAEYGGRSPDQLSGGQRQRVGVARALAAEPEVMLMDEPFGSLDPVTRAELQEEVKRIQEALGLTVILVTHDMTEAMLMADRIAVMRRGELLQVGAPSELLNRPARGYVRRLVETPKRRAERLEERLGLTA